MSLPQIAREIRLARKQLKMNQAEFAKALNASQGSISKWESGKETPRIETLEKIAQLHPAFNYSPAQYRVVPVPHSIMDHIAAVPVMGFLMEGDPVNHYPNPIECQLLVDQQWADHKLEAFLIEGRSERARLSGGTKLITIARFREGDTVHDVRGQFLVGLKREREAKESLFIARHIIGHGAPSALWPITDFVMRTVHPIPLTDEGQPAVAHCRVLGVIIAVTTYELNVSPDTLEPPEF
ncbi:helix-turn-helix domain-containing protein [Sinorhizobium meliloti]|uniref:helix-turn-helix domain-containing protein n=1 Tax=Rhizobium meliloti TaxID=382 RepID=UPI000FD85A22|nr:helix-turn-helix transcriptional regulator [Sinorhizobium meliloti]RVK40879.1 XRE family transcriptional regulator [Sinorhizobium meliloti]